MSTIKFPLHTSPTHEIVQWSPNFEPIVIPIPLGCGIVPTTPKDEQTHSFEFRKPDIGTFNLSNIHQGTLHLSDNSDTNNGITNKEVARAFQDKTFQKNFKLLVAQEIVKFNQNLEGSKSKFQDNPMLKTYNLRLI